MRLFLERVDGDIEIAHPDPFAEFADQALGKDQSITLGVDLFVEVLGVFHQLGVEARVAALEEQFLPVLDTQFLGLPGGIGEQQGQGEQRFDLLSVQVVASFLQQL